MHKRSLCHRAVSVRLSVRLSVCLAVCHVRVLYQIFSPSDRPTILVFPYQTLWQYSDGDPLNWRKKLRFSMTASMTAGPSSLVNISTAELS